MNWWKKILRWIEPPIEVDDFWDKANQLSAAERGELLQFMREMEKVRLRAMSVATLPRVMEILRDADFVSVDKAYGKWRRVVFSFGCAEIEAKVLTRSEDKP